MFKRATANELETGPSLRAIRARDAEPDLICAGCGHKITATSQAIEIDGKHQHVCTNPESITFNIGCFATAVGCVQRGPATGQYTWFAGYQWQVALCANCWRHLGWRFSSAAHSFYGLILANLENSGSGSNGK